MTSLWDAMKDVIPNDHARQVTSEYYIDRIVAGLGELRTVLDLGCGVGASCDAFETIDGDVTWVGVDIADSQEVAARGSTGRRIVSYDGVALPFADGSFAAVYSHQVLEHVRHPVRVLREVARVLAPGGVFAGSTSQLETYHSRSVWNYTLYGFRSIVESAGLRLVEVRPGIDGIALITRAYRGRPNDLSRWFVDESPLNAEIDAWGKTTGRAAKLVNLRKLEYCGQFSFLACAPRVRPLRAPADTPA